MYRLAPGISFCAVADRLLFLDLAHDRYFCLGASAEESFRRLVAAAALTPDDAVRLAHLCGTVLVAAGSGCRPVPCQPPAPPATSLLDDARPAGFGAATKALLTYRRTAQRLRRRGFASTLQALAARKADAQPPGPRSDFRLRATAAAFQRAARWTSLHDRCLPHSIAVAWRLAGCGATASLVIGVRLHPFRAHAWVQQGALLINDRLDTVREFTPILLI